MSGFSETMLALEVKVRDALQSLFESSAQTLEGLKVTTEINNGRAFVEILKRSQSWKADLIILGAKGTASLEQIIVGSTAEHVVRGARCSVMVVR